MTKARLFNKLYKPKKRQRCPMKYMSHTDLQISYPSTAPETSTLKQTSFRHCPYKNIALRGTGIWGSTYHILHWASYTSLAIFDAF